MRQFGSNNVGAINVFRVGGPWLGIVTLFCDSLKAVAVVMLASAITNTSWVIAVAAMLVLVGHAFSIYFYAKEGHFSEGKAVASGIGVYIGLTAEGVLPPWLVGATVALWLAVLTLPRLASGRWPCISPATMIATAATPLMVIAVCPQPAFEALSLAMAALVLYRHKNNLKRLVAGTEPRLGERGRLTCG